ncbi:hypothetical protein [Noviherbaspirillum massiliense]|uniref:hypothetical protein n=1 Tax=Noviherbaspirillum massiliense TaxID=1465823 RepID=UPI00037E499B|nr:hypothetical protein [Noviherbaspirillum massiliense]
MKRTAPLLLFLLISLAHAETVEERVKLAREAEAAPELKQYPAALFRKGGRRFARTMRSCARLKPAPEHKAFVLVADITPEGKASAVAVEPATNVAECFAEGFAAGTYPKPPAYPGREGFPVTMKLRIER